MGVQVPPGAPNTMAKYYTCPVDKDPNSEDYILTFSDEFLKENDWREGDEINFKNENGQILLTNLTKELRERLESKK